ncbi:tripartite tricarboxylate transporter TctB family protein [Pseudorhodoplanes sinuspersici]|nr:tripartite tricarboxylate transporter TctB family protein [Pseudorhodoplanes sinuspersici]RKE67403.1 tripartite tricarboxylate transporter TctB family protein [Pseudorhodoplanes sinuspersici]
MNIRADQVAGGAFILLGILVFIIGWDLPFGRLSAPGAGMLPKLMAGLMIALAAGIAINGQRGEKLSEIPWSDWPHAALIILISGIATVLYTTLGFIITMTLLVFSLLVIVERRRLWAAATYAVLLTLFAYVLFGTALKAPLERGLLWF